MKMAHIISVMQIKINEKILKILFNKDMLLNKKKINLKKIIIKKTLFSFFI